MQESDFWVDDPVDPSDLFGKVRRRLDLDRVKDLARGPIAGDDDLASCLALTRTVLDAYRAFGTDGATDFSGEDSRVALQALKMALERRGHDLKLPWRDFASFRSYWIRVGASGTGGWQARRELLSEHFDPILEALEEAEEEQFRAELAEAVSPLATTGWPMVDQEIAGLRQRFRSATSMQDYRDCGNRSVAVLEALSATVFDPTKHLPPSGEKAPPVDKTDVRIGAYLAERLSGADNEELRGLVKKASALAHKVKHSPRADRTSAGIAADATILLANMLRRLAE